MNKFLLACLLALSVYACSSSAAHNTEEQTAHSSPVTADTTKETSASVDSKKDTIAQLNFSLDYIRGRFNPAKHPDFMKVPSQYTDGSRSYYMRKDACLAFQQMHDAAAADGISLKIISATRNFNRQKTIWEAKWTGARLLEGKDKAPEVYPEAADRALAILRWSSMPGTSRHHWGTDIDINRLTNDYFESGQGLKEYEWLTNHGANFGFCQPYSPKGDQRPHGYNEEKWHWSYKPVAEQLTRLAKEQLKDQQIDGFKGAETATDIKVVERYVLGISHHCQ